MSEPGGEAPTPRIHMMRMAFDEDTGSFEIEGIPRNKVTAYGMIGLARDMIEKLAEGATVPMVIPGGLPFAGRPEG